MTTYIYVYVCLHVYVYIFIHIWIHRYEKVQSDTYWLVNMCYLVDRVWGGIEKWRKGKGEKQEKKWLLKSWICKLWLNLLKIIYILHTYVVFPKKLGKIKRCFSTSL